jgi:hypothetical protein
MPAELPSMKTPYKNKTPKARCILKIQDWFANNLSIITQPVRDEMAELLVNEIIDDINQEEEPCSFCKDWPCGINGTLEQCPVCGSMVKRI